MPTSVGKMLTMLKNVLKTQSTSLSCNLRLLSSAAGLSRQRGRPDGELPRDAPHWLEGVPAAALLPAGHRGVRRGGGRGLPEEAGEEQEVLLRGPRGWGGGGPAP